MSKKESKKAKIARPKKEAEEVARKVEDLKKIEAAERSCKQMMSVKVKVTVTSSDSEDEDKKEVEENNKNKGKNTQNQLEPVSKKAEEI